MSSAPVTGDELAESYQESLTERFRRGRLPVAEALLYAAQIAACLRDLHMQGLVYGDVNSQTIMLGPSGASLPSDGTPAHLGEPHYDVVGFGAMLEEMLRRVEGPKIMQIEIGQLAVRCRTEALDMQQVLITLRLLTLRARLGPVAVSLRGAA